MTNNKCPYCHNIYITFNEDNYKTLPQLYLKVNGINHPCKYDVYLDAQKIMDDLTSEVIFLRENSLALKDEIDKLREKIKNSKDSSETPKEPK